MKGSENLPLRFQLQPARRVASKCSNGVSPVDLANDVERLTVQFPVLDVEGQHAMHRIPQRNSMSRRREQTLPPPEWTEPGLREIRSQGNSKLDEASAWSGSQGSTGTLSSRNNAKASLQSGRFRRAHDAIRAGRDVTIAFAAWSRWECGLLRAPLGRRKQRTVGECPDFRTTEGNEMIDKLTPIEKLTTIEPPRPPEGEQDRAVGSYRIDGVR